MLETVVDRMRAERCVGWTAYLHLREDGNTIERCFLRRGKRVWWVRDLVPALLGQRGQRMAAMLALDAVDGLTIWRVQCDRPWLWRGLEYTHMELAIGQVLRTVRSFGGTNG
jgi:hypothetical protein